MKKQKQKTFHPQLQRQREQQQNDKQMKQHQNDKWNNNRTTNKWPKTNTRVHVERVLYKALFEYFLGQNAQKVEKNTYLIRQHKTCISSK